MPVSNTSISEELPLVSVVITTHNRKKRLLRAIESVLAQTYPNIELIVVDDASDDGTEEQCASSRDFRYVRIHPDESNGACRARNKGLECAQGDLIAFLDDDDEWLPRKIERQVSLMSEGVSIVSSQWESEKRDGEWVRHLASDMDWELPYLLMRCWGGATSVPLLRTAAVKSVGGFDESVVKGQDHDLWIRLVAAGYRERTVREPLILYYKSQDSVYRGIDRLLSCTERKLEVYGHLYAKYPVAKCYLLNDTAFECLKQKEFKEYFRYKLRAISVRPFCKWNLFELLYAIKKFFRKDFFIAK